MAPPGAALGTAAEGFATCDSDYRVAFPRSRVPGDWHLRLPGRGPDSRVAAVNRLSWMETLFPYWEGPVRVSGSRVGVEYLEMTGHD